MRLLLALAVASVLPEGDQAGQPGVERQRADDDSALDDVLVVGADIEKDEAVRDGRDDAKPDRGAPHRPRSTGERRPADHDDGEDVEDDGGIGIGLGPVYRPSGRAAPYSIPPPG